jgi:uncharacterized protein YecE (DUF72 family)
MDVYVGTSGYAYKEWIGRFYPEKTPSKEMLRSYSERLITVEINNTFYHMPTSKVLMSWVEQVPAGFVFAFKAPQMITHFKRLRQVDTEIEYLFKTLSILHERLGPVLFQFPKTFRVDPGVLSAFLDTLPHRIHCAFEFRSLSQQTTEIIDLLRNKGRSLCIADSDDNPTSEIVRTASWGYMRLRRSNYTEADLSEWAMRVLTQEWEKAFVFFKHEDEAKGPELAMRFQQLIRQGQESRSIIRKSPAQSPLA